MASNKTGQKSRKADPMRTKNGNPRLGPLNVPQLEKLLTSARKKHQAKITRRIAVIKGRPGYKAPAVEAVAE
jgi:hypothetical protein